MAHLQRSENSMPDYLSIARRALERPKELIQPESLEDVLKGLAIELWSDRAGCLFIVADEEDARRLGERGAPCTRRDVNRQGRIARSPGHVRGNGFARGCEARPR
jgi:hypothetical protein